MSFQPFTPKPLSQTLYLGIKSKLQSFIYLFYFFLISFLLISCEKTENTISPDSVVEWQTYNVTNGLGDNFVWSIFEDNDGNIWVGTVNNGVSKFDGKNWTIYNAAGGLIDNSVISIEQDSDGDMWFGTLNGISILSGNNWTNLDNIAGYQFTAWALLNDSEGNMWVGTSLLGLLQFSNDQWYQIFDSNCNDCNKINVIYEDNDNNIWFGSDGDLKRYANNNLNSYTASNGLPEGAVESIHQDNYGNIWFGTSGGAFVAKYNNGIFNEITLFNGMPIYYITSITSDRFGNVWFGLIEDGLIRYDGAIMKSFFEKDGLPDNTITSLLKDSNGHLWVGTSEGGISKHVQIDF